MFRVWSSDEGPPSHSVPAHLVAKAAAHVRRRRVRARCTRALLHAYFAENRDISNARDAARDLARGRAARARSSRAPTDPELLRQVGRGAQPGDRARRRRRARRAMEGNDVAITRRAADRALPPLDPQARSRHGTLGDVMRIGLQIPSFTWPGGAAALARASFAEIARTADDAGFASFWVMDHFFQIPMVGAAEQEMLESYSALSFAAGVTKRVDARRDGHRRHLPTPRRVGQDRDHARRAVARARLSGHRRGLVRARARGPGRALPAAGRALRAARGDAADRAPDVVAGRTARSRASTTSWPRRCARPRPSRSPRPKILIGGGGEKKTLRLVARYADACNLFEFLGPDGLAPQARRAAPPLRHARSATTRRSRRPRSARSGSRRASRAPRGDREDLPRAGRDRHRPGDLQPAQRPRARAARDVREGDHSRRQRSSSRRRGSAARRGAAPATPP